MNENMCPRCKEKEILNFFVKNGFLLDQVLIDHISKYKMDLETWLVIFEDFSRKTRTRVIVFNHLLEVLK